MPDVYLRSIDLPVGLVLGYTRWKSTQAHEVRRQQEGDRGTAKY